MKIKIKLSQLKEILKTEPLKFPMTFKGEDFTDKEFSMFQKLLQTK